MSKRWGLAVLITCFVGICGEARAQSAAPGDWTVTVYPVFLWLPVDIGLATDVEGGDGGGSVSGEILDSRFDGAYSAASQPPMVRGVWRAMASGPRSAATGRSRRSSTSTST